MQESVANCPPLQLESTRKWDRPQMNQAVALFIQMIVESINEKRSNNVNDNNNDNNNNNNAKNYVQTLLEERYGDLLRSGSVALSSFKESCGEEAFTRYV